MSGFGSAGAGNRTGRRTASACGVGSSARERDRRATRATAGSLHDVPPTLVLEAIRQGHCAFCDDPRTFLNVTTHLTKGHGFGRIELADYLNIPRHQGLASDEFRRAARERAIARDAAASMRGVPQRSRTLGPTAVAHNRRIARLHRPIDRVCPFCGAIYHSMHERRSCPKAECRFRARSVAVGKYERTDAHRALARALLARNTGR